MEVFPTCQIWPGCCSRKRFESQQCAAGLKEMLQAHCFRWSQTGCSYITGSSQTIWQMLVAEHIIVLFPPPAVTLLPSAFEQDVKGQIACGVLPGAYVSKGINADVTSCYTNKAFPYLPNVHGGKGWADMWWPLHTGVSQYITARNDNLALIIWNHH